MALKSEERVKNDQILVVIDQDKKQGGLADFFNQKTIFLWLIYEKIFRDALATCLHAKVLNANAA